MSIRRYTLVTLFAVAATCMAGTVSAAAMHDGMTAPQMTHGSMHHDTMMKKGSMTHKKMMKHGSMHHDKQMGSASMAHHKMMKHGSMGHGTKMMKQTSMGQ
ncbi:MAG TPA: hypothetical protein VFQ88_02540 [Nevskiaceae bacterium]|nr:hypothetical protein [Nevskiaceae bacterium]